MEEIQRNNRIEDRQATQQFMVLLIGKFQQTTNEVIETLIEKDVYTHGMAKQTDGYETMIEDTVSQRCEAMHQVMLASTKQVIANSPNTVLAVPGEQETQVELDTKIDSSTGGLTNQSNK